MRAAMVAATTVAVALNVTAESQPQPPVIMQSNSSRASPNSSRVSAVASAAVSLVASAAVSVVASAYMKLHLSHHVRC